MSTPWKRKSRARGESTLRDPNQIVPARDGTPMLTTAQKAVELGCSVPTLWRRVARGDVAGPTTYHGRAWFLSEATIAAEAKRKPPARARRPAPEAEAETLPE